MKKHFILLCCAFVFTAACNSSGGSGNTTEASGKEESPSSPPTDPKKYTEGKDYYVYERSRVLDKIAFTEPQEAYSLLLPKGWTCNGDIIWNQPGTACAGTNKHITVKSADGNMQFAILPDVLYSWSSNQELNAINAQSSAPNCETREPVEAEAYLRNIFAAELGNPQIVKVESNQEVIRTLQQQSDKNIAEMRQYGAGQMRTYPGAVNATVRWADGKEGLIVLGVNIMETQVPDVYTGGMGSFYTTSISNRTVFTYPAAKAEEAKGIFATIMAGIRTNPEWNESVNRFWKNYREQRHVEHLGTLRIMDERTRQIGEQAVRAGQERLKAMDNQARSWEQRQHTSDKIHTDFIKTIREVENYQDPTGTYEMSSHYDHAWSRGDGSTFLMSNDPNFDPSSVFRDQRWEEMQRVR